MHKQTLILLERLLAASQGDRIKWTEVTGKTAFSYVAGDYVLVIDAADGRALFRLSDDRGRTLEEAGEDDLRAAQLAGGGTALDAVREMHAIAKRQTSGVDTAIATVLEHLQSLGGEAGGENGAAGQDGDTADTQGAIASESTTPLKPEEDAERQEETGTALAKQTGTEPVHAASTASDGGDDAEAESEPESGKDVEKDALSGSKDEAEAESEAETASGSKDEAAEDPEKEAAAKGDSEAKPEPETAAANGGEEAGAKPELETAAANGNGDAAKTVEAEAASNGNGKAASQDAAEAQSDAEADKAAANAAAGRKKKRSLFHPFGGKA